MVDYLTVRDSFVKLSAAIEKGKLLDNISLGEKTISSLSVIGIDKQTLQIYSFGNDITIARERHEQSGKTHFLIQSGRNPIYSNDPYSYEWSSYYVLKGNGLVTDEKEVKKIIQETTGVNLPVLNAQNIKDLGPMDVKSTLKRRIYRKISDNVVTKITKHEEPVKQEFSDYRPRDREMLREVHEIEKVLGQIHGGFGFETPKEFGEKFNTLRQVSEKVSKELTEKTNS